MGKYIGIEIRFVSWRMNLFYRQTGNGKPLIILHGLFGSSDNWYSLAKEFSRSFSVFLVDQRNHGQSPHTDEMNYALLAEDLAAFIEQQSLDQPYIIGHSMGGKAAMNFAVKYPERLSRLIVVDIVPKPYPVHHDKILEGLKSIPLTALESRSKADELLSAYVPEPEVRQFLLKNLSRNQEGGFDWKINLKSLDEHIEDLGAGMQFEGQFTGSTLFITGERSNYFQPGDEALIRSFFPNAKFTTLDTGHWVQAERPEAFLKVALDFLA